MLRGAARARTRRRRKKAIALYRWVLAVEPGNAEIHGKLAPLLAKSGQRFDAWVSFRRAARGLAREGLTEKALGIYREAASSLPRQLETWLAIFELERQRGRDADAREALLKGRRHFRTRRLRPQAIYLLRRIRSIDPWEIEIVLDLARLLSKTHQQHEAQMLLEELASRSQGRALRRARATLLRMRPSIANMWLWLHAALLSRDGAPARLRASSARRGR
ncbi:MAG: hypothetical protein V3V67_07380 [Myxococcota bacterium]